MKLQKYLVQILAGLLIFSCQTQSLNSEEIDFSEKSTVINDITTRKNKSITVYEIKRPEKDNFDNELIEVELDSVLPTFLKFPSGGTETNIAVYDSAYLSYFKSTYEPTPIKSLNFHFKHTGLMDISDFSCGVYIISYGSCSGGGKYKMRIK